MNDAKMVLLFFFFFFLFSNFLDFILSKDRISPSIFLDPQCAARKELGEGIEKFWGVRAEELQRDRVARDRLVHVGNNQEGSL